MLSGFAQHVRGRALPLVQVLAAAHQLKLISRGFQDWIYLPSEPDELIAADTPRPSEPPRYSFAGLVFSDLDAIQKGDVIRAIHDARQAPGIDFLTFNRMRDALWSVLQRDQGAISNLINNMVDVGVLRIEGERFGRDPATNVTYPFKTFALDLQDSDVRKALKIGV
jgi:hypothetical protein